MAYSSEIRHVPMGRRIHNVGGLDEAVITREHWVLRWSYNGLRDESDHYGASVHNTPRGARIADALRRRAARKWK